MKKEKKEGVNELKVLKNFVTQPRIYSIVIIIAILVASFTNSLQSGWIIILSLLMSWLIFAQSFILALEKNPDAKKILGWIVVVLLAIGILLFFII